MLGSERRVCLAGLGDSAGDWQGLVGLAEPVEQLGDEVAAGERVGMLGSERRVYLAGLGDSAGDWQGLVGMDEPVEQ